MRATDPNPARPRGTRLLFAGFAAALGLLAFGPPSAFASDIELDQAELLIEGDADADAIVISTDGTTITVTDTGVGGATAGPGCAQANPTTVTCPAVSPDGPVNDYEANLDDGVDSFTNQNLAVVEGHVHSEGALGAVATGSKTIVGGPGDELLLGGADNDSIDGGEGNDELDDGGGNDEDGPTTGGNDVLIGGPGDDEANYFRGDANTTITIDGLANDGMAGEADNVQVESVSTGGGNDVLVGDGSANVFVAGEGSDLLRGLGGNDELIGDFDFSGGMPTRGGSVVDGGNDTLDGGAGRDRLDCGPGFDLALREPLDQVATNCERIGAEVVGDSAALTGKRKNKFKVEIACPESEIKACTGKLKITAGSKKAGKGKFSVAAGKTKKSKAKLTKKGAKKVRRAGGSLLMTVIAKTNEPGGVSVDSGPILVHK